MTTLTVNIENQSDLTALQETLDKLGLAYDIQDESEYIFSQDEINGFLKTNQDITEGKTTVRDWKDVESDLKRAFH
jgi:geranylgeranyl pyrophosphate synthase